MNVSWLHWWSVNIGSGNGLVQARQQAITWANVDSDLWLHMAPLGSNVFKDSNPTWDHSWYIAHNRNLPNSQFALRMVLYRVCLTHVSMILLYPLIHTDSAYYFSEHLVRHVQTVVLNVYLIWKILLKPTFSQKPYLCIFKKLWRISMALYKHHIVSKLSI